MSSLLTFSILGALAVSHLDDCTSRVKALIEVMVKHDVMGTDDLRAIAESEAATSPLAASKGRHISPNSLPMIQAWEEHLRDESLHWSEVRHFAREKIGEVKAADTVRRRSMNETIARFKPTHISTDKLNEAQSPWSLDPRFPDEIVIMQTSEKRIDFVKIAKTGDSNYLRSRKFSPLVRGEAKFVRFQEKDFVAALTLSNGPKWNLEIRQDDPTEKKSKFFAQINLRQSPDHFHVLANEYEILVVAQSRSATDLHFINSAGKLIASLSGIVSSQDTQWGHEFGLFLGSNLMLPDPWGLKRKNSSWHQLVGFCSDEGTVKMIPFEKSEKPFNVRGSPPNIFFVSFTGDPFSPNATPIRHPGVRSLGWNANKNALVTIFAEASESTAANHLELHLAHFDSQGNYQLYKTPDDFIPSSKYSDSVGPIATEWMGRILIAAVTKNNSVEFFQIVGSNLEWTFSLSLPLPLEAIEFASQNGKLLLVGKGPDEKLMLFRLESDPPPIGGTP